MAPDLPSCHDGSLRDEASVSLRATSRAGAYVGAVLHSCLRGSRPRFLSVSVRWAPRRDAATFSRSVAEDGGAGTDPLPEWRGPDHARVRSEVRLADLARKLRR